MGQHEKILAKPFSKGASVGDGAESAKLDVDVRRRLRIANDLDHANLVAKRDDT